MIRFRSVALPAITVLLALALPVRADLRLDAGAGLFSAFSGDQRAAYGANPSFESGLSSALGNNGARMFLEGGYVRGTGSEFTPDPTFQSVDEAGYHLFPIRIGVRFDMNGNPEQPLRLFLGLGLQTLFTRWEGAGGSFSSPSGGAFVELRPEYRAGETWSVWIRQRFDIVAEIDYEPGLTLDYGGSTLAIGLSFSLDHAPLTPPRNDS